MKISVTFKTTAILCIALSGAAFAASHLSPEVQQAITDRQAHMKKYGETLGPLGNMAKGEMPYDAATAAAAANTLAELANLDQSGFWVEGSDIAAAGGRAKAEIWTDMSGFEADMADLAAAATALAAVAGNDLDSLKAAMGPVGAACGACHETYRGPRT